MEDLTRDAILGADDLPRREVEVPEWGGRLWVRTMTGLERDRYEAGLVVEPGTKRADRLANLRARLVALTAVDAAGERLFAETDVEALGYGCSPKPMSRRSERSHLRPWTEWPTRR